VLAGSCTAPLSSGETFGLEAVDEGLAHLSREEPVLAKAFLDSAESLLESEVEAVAGSQG
jgi:hypothetical protein